jgi:hypothetical protein
MTSKPQKKPSALTREHPALSISLGHFCPLGSGSGSTTLAKGKFNVGVGVYSSDPSRVDGFYDHH